jgi:hypothetical protein
MVYERQIATATRLIQKYGQACTWREPGTPTGNPANPTPAAPVDYPVNIVFLDNSTKESLAGFLSMMGETDVPTGGLRGLMAAVPFSPSLMGKVSRNTEFEEPALSIVDKNGIDVLNINGEIILYKLRFVR